ncbi:MAG TPA: glycosyltransferase [Nitrososphaerales archaeon]|nr:glycosyltransferase [Nitrososphaerales archaeon]
MTRLAEYETIVGREIIAELSSLASRVKRRKIVHVNSAKNGGGVAELLSSIVPLMQELGFDVRWETMRGDEEFFKMTKAIHNSLQRGLDVADLTYVRTIAERLEPIRLEWDIIFVHDPQPLGLVAERVEDKAEDDSVGSHLKPIWIWQCHIQITNPSQNLWKSLEDNYVRRYDAAIFSAEYVPPKDLGTREFIIAPSIDPLSEKNKELDQTFIEGVLQSRGLGGRPIITQVSRFDYAKDPIGVIEAFQKVRKRFDCELVLAGSFAADDPEGLEVYSKVTKMAEGNKDIHVLNMLSDLEINAIQRASTIIIQKSLKEGFGLTVSEALWKSKPVIGGATGGIVLQIKDGETGLLVSSVDEAAEKIEYVLEHPKEGEMLGRNGKEYVRENFLITRQLRDYLKMILELEEKKT